MVKFIHASPDDSAPWGILALPFLAGCAIRVPCIDQEHSTYVPEATWKQVTTTHVAPRKLSATAAMSCASSSAKAGWAPSTVLATSN